MRISKNIIIHILIWVLYAVINYLVRWIEFDMNPGYSTFFVDSITKDALGCLFFYISSTFIYKFLPKLFYFSFWWILGLFTHNLLRFFCYSTLFNFVDNTYIYPYSYWECFPTGFSAYLRYSIFGFAFYSYEKLKITTDILLAEQKKSLYLQTENLKLEYKFLRAQINPHFLYNVLGFFYNKVNTKDENAGRGIMLLTEMMRYSIREPEADDKVLLQEEIKAINNLLDLQKLRFEGTTHAVMHVAEGMEQLRIVPHVLVTLVENACKHGDLTHQDDPLKITAKLYDGWFVFTTINRIRTAKSVERTDGFGLENLATRLSLQYSDNQYFAYGKEGDYYKVTFKLKAAIMAEDDAGADLINISGNQTQISEKQNKWLPA